ncbi:MAG: DUF5680 domain-containing protein [Anaerolineales bacterium]|jgi:hypothetical protein
MVDQNRLGKFILEAKSTTYVGDGTPIEPCRIKSHDLVYEQDEFKYLDSYFGGSDFIGEEVVYAHAEPVWGMNYYGSILKPDKISPAEAGAMIKASLQRMYVSGRFLGGWEYQLEDLIYHDTSEGGLTHFTGYEWIEKEGQKVYELFYHGGLIL